MAKKGPTPKRKVIDNPCLHCEKRSRLRRGVWCSVCTAAGRRREQSLLSARSRNRDHLDPPLTGMRWWTWSLYRDSDPEAYLLRVMEELGGDEPVELDEAV